MAVNEATHTVYVIDRGNNRVERFSSTGAFLGQFDGSGEYEVEGKIEKGVPAGGGGREGEVKTGKLDFPGGINDIGGEPKFGGIAVDNSCVLRKLTGSECTKADPSNGDVYVIDRDQGKEITGSNPLVLVDKFGPDGEYVGQIANATLKEREPGAIEEPEPRVIVSVAVDINGEVWLSVEDNTSASVFYGNVVDNLSDAIVNKFIAYHPVEIPGQAPEAGLAVDAKDDLYASLSSGSEPSFIAEFNPNHEEGGGFIGLQAHVGPHTEVLNEAVVEEAVGGAERLRGMTVEQTSSDLYVDSTLAVSRFGSDGSFLERLVVPGGSGGSIAVDSSAQTIYVADLGDNTILAAPPEKPGIPTVEAGSESVSNVTADSAALAGRINPRSEPGEAATEYSFEYGQCASLSVCAGSVDVPMPEGVLAPTYGPENVGVRLQGLSAGTTYRFRLVAHNSYGAAEAGEERTFTTQTTGAFVLPDGRGWELVSPPDKDGADLLPIGGAGTGLVQASVSGDAIVYSATGPTESGGQGNGDGVEVLSRHTMGGWESQDIVTPNAAAVGSDGNAGDEYRFFSLDLSLGVAEPLGVFDSAISSEGSERTPYLRTNFAAGEVGQVCTELCYRPLVTGAPGFENVPPGTKFSPTLDKSVFFVGASPDLKHVALWSTVALTEGAPADSLYEWSGGELALVSILPGGQPAPTGGNLGDRHGVVRNAVSADGSRVVWTEAAEGRGGHLYLRNMTAEHEQTVELDTVKGGTGEGTEAPTFQFASSDDSRVFFTDQQRLTTNSGASAGKPDLYECEMVGGEDGLECKLSDLTPLNAGNESASVQGSVIGGSEDGTTLYFIANGVLAAGKDSAGEEAVRGTCQGESSAGETCNLYVDRDGTVGLVAILSGADGNDWNHDGGGLAGLAGLTARVSPDGEWLAFMSLRSLTGYDNLDVVSGEPDEEVYLYHGAGEGRAVCASCDPTGARPHGVKSEQLGDDSLVNGQGVEKGNVWLAGNVPGWTPIAAEGLLALYQSHYLSDSGRLFFNSSDALVAQDTNGTEDVYEYEPVGVGDCSVSESTYVGGEGGCVDLISSGASVEESAFLDASEDGDDVFFLTSAQLSKQDTDTSLDVYDARVGGVEAERAPPVECQGDACQHPVSAPEDPTPGSLTYSGPGNITIGPAPVEKGKTKQLTRTQKLANALRSCRKKTKGKQRSVCERHARAAYGSRVAHKTANARRRGR